MEAFSFSIPPSTLKINPSSINPRTHLTFNTFRRINPGFPWKQVDRRIDFCRPNPVVSLQNSYGICGNTNEGSKLIRIGSADALTGEFELGSKGKLFHTIRQQKKYSICRNTIGRFQLIRFRTGSTDAAFSLTEFPLGSKLRLFHSNPLQKQQLKCRNIVAQSQLVGTGSPDAEYPLTEFGLGSKLRAIGFYTVTAVLAIFLFVVMLGLHPFVLLFDRYQRKAHHVIAKIWASLTFYPFIDVKFEGLENLPPDNTPAVYVSNHQSFLDIYTLLILGRSFKFISKTGIFVFPIVGWAMFLMGLIPLRRMDSRSQLDCLKRCMDLVRKGASVFFFPEGTRSKDGKLGAFKKGAFSVAAKTGAPVVPITLMGTGKLMPTGMEDTLNTGSIKAVIHKPIEGSNPDILCDEARNVIAEVLIHHGYGVHHMD